METRHVVLLRKVNYTKDKRLVNILNWKLQKEEKYRIITSTHLFYLDGIYIIYNFSDNGCISLSLNNSFSWMKNDK